MIAKKDFEEKHDRVQLRGFLGVALGSAAFALQEWLEMLGGHGPTTVLLTILALVRWLTAGWSLFASSKLASHPDAARVLDDERVASHRASAFEFGFGAVLLTQVLVLVGHDALAKFASIELTIGFATSASMAAAFIASFGRFVYLNR